MKAAKTYSTAGAFRRALEDRLESISREEHIDLQRVRRQVAFDRLLVRLFLGSNPLWLLKGGYALELKLAVARTTKDVDLGVQFPPGGGEDLPDAILAALQDAAGQPSDDFFEFSIGEATMDLDGAPYGGARFPVEAKNL